MNDSQLIFLISLPRSGSTMLQRMLGAHTQIYTRSEPWLMLHPMSAFKGAELEANYGHGLAAQGTKDFFSGLDDDNPESIYFSGIGDAYLKFYQRYLAESGKTLFLDKTPRYFLVFDELQMAFPNAKFVILKRNPLAVLSSVMDTWVEGDYYKLSSYKVDLDDGAAFFGRDFSHFDNCYELTYEELAEKPKETMNDLCRFLDIDFEESTVNYGQAKQDKWSFGDQGVVYQKSHPDKSHANRWIAGLSSGIKRQFLSDYLERLGAEKFVSIGYDYDLAKQQLVDSENSPENDQAFEKYALDYYLDRKESVREQKFHETIFHQQQEFEKLSTRIHEKNAELSELREQFSAYKQQVSEREATLSQWVHEKQQELETLRKKKESREAELSEWVHQKQRELVALRAEFAEYKVGIKPN